jgi:L-lysine 2,3-aminomutase
MFQMTFPQAGMLDPADLHRMVDLVRSRAPERHIEGAAREIQRRLNPHPAGQKELNATRLDGRTLPGMQHKYRKTVLFFPSQGQTCHAYCTYCFRWAQFVGIDELKFASHETESLTRYLRAHPEVSSVLFTGGDPLIMRTAILRRYVEPLLERGLEHVTSIRLGTKATAYWPYRFVTDDDADDLLRLFEEYWPYRFVTDDDADDLLRLFEEVRLAGKHLALMSHYSLPRELETHVARAALRRIHDTGTISRCQAPIVRHVNDNVEAWAEMWRLQVRLGAVPYYMFVERDTGPKSYFEVALARAHEIFRDAYRRVSGLAQTVRGPSMSATPGKVAIDGVADIAGERVFVLRFLQGRHPEWVGLPFFARYDEQATWLTQLSPAFGEERFFFESKLDAIKRGRRFAGLGVGTPKRGASAVIGSE